MKVGLDMAFGTGLPSAAYLAIAARVPYVVGELTAQPVEVSGEFITRMAMKNP
jgi:hypothetical protein